MVRGGWGHRPDPFAAFIPPIRNGLKISLGLFFPFFLVFLGGIWEKLRAQKTLSENTDITGDDANL